jgi:hypothetical protein
MPDHFIPFRRSELVDLLCAEPELSVEDADAFRQFCRLLTTLCTFEYYRLLEKIKSAYAPFDPDSDTRSLKETRSEERQHKLIDLLGDFAWVMERGNYRHLTREDIEPAVGTRTDWGLLVDVDYRIFERLAIFARGDTTDRRTRRKLRRLFRSEEVDVPVYSRLVMIMKLRKHPRLGAHINTDKVYLQIFKNIPKLDINMLMPGARVRMTRLDRSKIGLPMLSGLFMALYNIVNDVIQLAIESFSKPLFLWGLATGAVTYGTRSYFSYLGTRQRYNLNLTQVLYFQNLDTNAGVLFRVLDEAHDQESRELFLTYYFLWRKAPSEGLGKADLAVAVGKYLEERTQFRLSMESEDALVKLHKLGVIQPCGDRWRALPIREALPLLDSSWVNAVKAVPVDRRTPLHEGVPGTHDYIL